MKSTNAQTFKTTETATVATTDETRTHDEYVAEGLAAWDYLLRDDPNRVSKWSHVRASKKGTPLTIAGYNLRAAYMALVCDSSCLDATTAEYGTGVSHRLLSALKWLAFYHGYEGIIPTSSLLALYGARVDADYTSRAPLALDDTLGMDVVARRMEQASGKVSDSGSRPIHGCIFVQPPTTVKTELVRRVIATDGKSCTTLLLDDAAKWSRTFDKGDAEDASHQYQLYKTAGRVLYAQRYGDSDRPYPWKPIVENLNVVDFDNSHTVFVNVPETVAYLRNIEEAAEAWDDVIDVRDRIVDAPSWIEFSWDTAFKNHTTTVVRIGKHLYNVGVLLDALEPMVLTGATKALMVVHSNEPKPTHFTAFHVSDAIVEVHSLAMPIRLTAEQSPQYAEAGLPTECLMLDAMQARPSWLDELLQDAAVEEKAA